MWGPTMLRTVPVLLAFLVMPGTVLAHHSVAGFFDPGDQVEIEGVVQKVRWRNPHTVFIVDVTEASGEVTTWTIESGALAVLRSRGLAREFVQPGDQVSVGPLTAEVAEVRGNRITALRIKALD